MHFFKRLLLSLFFLFGHGCTTGGPRAPEVTIQYAPPSVEVGRNIFQTSCAPCHGILGDGNGRAVTHLKTRPRDLTRGEYAFRTTPAGEIPTDDDLFNTISKGIYGTAMKGFATTLTDYQRRSVVAYIKTLSDMFPVEVTDSDADEVEPFEIELVSNGQEELGKKLYSKMGCTACHGVSGKGDGPSSSGLKNNVGELVKPRDFSQDVLKRGKSREATYLTIKFGLDGTPMPSYSDSLSEEEIWALVDYINTFYEEEGLLSGLFEWFGQRADIVHGE